MDNPQDIADLYAQLLLKTFTSKVTTEIKEAENLMRDYETKDKNFFENIMRILISDKYTSTYNLISKTHTNFQYNMLILLKLI